MYVRAFHALFDQIRHRCGQTRVNSSKIFLMSNSSEPVEFLCYAETLFYTYTLYKIFIVIYFAHIYVFFLLLQFCIMFLMARESRLASHGTFIHSSYRDFLLSFECRKAINK